jgi:hypothetical protein
MAKMMKVNSDDVLREYRIRALTSPLSAYEMTHLDREMGDILSRTDLATDRKMKLFYDALNKFQVTRKNYIHQSAAVLSNQQQQQQPSVKPDDAVKNETKMDQSINDEYDTVLNDGSSIVASTPISRSQLSPSLFPDLTAGTTTTPKKDIETKVLTELGDTKTLTNNIISELNSSSGGVIYSPGGAKNRIIGNISDIEPIVERLTHPQKLRQLKKKGVNSELVEFVTGIINSKYISRLPSKSKLSVVELFPNLKPTRAGSSVPLRWSTRGSSPIALRSHAKNQNQSGTGRILKIFFNKWNQLLA